mmetsp:Transcript_25561/g.51018  ORF Transcript_25561/g.51018 Transcript_25561/m.51018 type:complete len:429 (+) Transcript_25561:169-1455(+)|eukprot:CAMPEP_0182455678 /NCGR_PEP_ID=MMETSP1319-20130603/1770_1 /TAXON_ID=172717 /ORGANISM="Bolidomonas pacifica, Strain RCC208" /LENGTH=428 /DNA_ID=CAMNT_0024653791 /DNA_START=107 /DNA_END=1393 /DNA_ORIENTATION=+
MDYVSYWTAYASASLRIFRFYTREVACFSHIHPDLPSGVLQETLKESISKRGIATTTLDARFGRDFNSKYRQLVPTLRQELKGKLTWSFKSILIASFFVRFLWFSAILKFGFWGSMGTGLWQFAVAPLSLVVCFMRFCTNGLDCVFHYIINTFVVLALNHAPFQVPSLSFILDFKFAVGFFLFDFLLNCIIYSTSSEPFGSKRFLKHVVYGTLNTKTYFLIVFASLSGLQVDLTTVVLTGIINYYLAKSGGRARILRSFGLPSFPVLFYCEHRLGHCPGVYPHAHKQHHYLHDTTAFDAHIYGSGMNEEYFWLLAEIVPCLLAPSRTLFPYFLNLETLYNSWTNKGGHTRSSGSAAAAVGNYDEDNFHADHHTQHNSNFGSADFPLIDFYFGSQAKNCVKVDDVMYELTREGDDVNVVMAKVAAGKGD